MMKHANYIAGEWVDGADWVPNINPSDINDVIGEYAHADEGLTRRAIEAARNAFAAWSLATPQVRADVLDRVGSEILASKDELGDLLAREEGKTLPEAVGEVVRAGQIFKFFAGEALRIVGDKQMSVRPGMEIEVTREPLGVVGIIAPWNFPIAIPAWKIAPALAYGNCVVFKPAELVPGSAWALAKIISRSGLPSGVFNLVMGKGRTVGETMLKDRDVNAISFTGSTSTGSRVAAACLTRHARFQLEMGGKNPLVVLNDADLDTAVHCAIQGAFFSTGQRCTASSRLIVEAGIHDQFVAALVRHTRALKVGNARSPGIEIGPVVDQTQLEQDLSYIEIGKQEGATLACGGEQVSSTTPGFYLSPALFVDTNSEMRINREEVFGPVASVIRVQNLDEALAVANDTEFGLTSGICTTSLSHATHFKRHAQAGMVMVNAPTAGVDFHVPFGGRKASSFGPREQGSYAIEFYTTIKTAYIQT